MKYKASEIIKDEAVKASMKRYFEEAESLYKTTGTIARGTTPVTSDNEPLMDIENAKAHSAPLGGYGGSVFYETSGNETIDRINPEENIKFGDEF